MERYKNLIRVISVQNLILASNSAPPSVSLDFVSRLSQRIHLNRGAGVFLRRYPHIFHIFNHPVKLQPFCSITPATLQIVRQESEAMQKTMPLAITRLVNLLSMSITDRIAYCLVPAVENWRIMECCKDECSMDRTELKYSFKHGFQPGMRLGKNLKAKVKEWQKLAYIGPYEEMGAVGINRTKNRTT